jgi:hypothetical protein
MNIKTILATFGAGDGEGSTSSTRLICLAFALAMLVVKSINAIKHGGDIEWTEQDLNLVKILFTTLVGKSVAEGLAAKLAPPATAVLPSVSSIPLAPINTNPNP